MNDIMRKHNPIRAASHHGEPHRPKVLAPIGDERPIKCLRDRCRGFRHPVGNCVVCGCGPCPGAVNFFGEPMPKSEREKQIVIWKLFNGVVPPTLNGRDYPSLDQLRDFKVPADISESRECLGLYPV